MPLQQREEIQEMPRTQVKTKAPPTKLVALPERKAEFIEPMDCAPVPKLIEGPEAPLLDHLQRLTYRLAERDQQFRTVPMRPRHLRATYA